MIFDALEVEVFWEEVKTFLVDEFFCKFIGLQEIEEWEGVCVHRDEGLFLLFNQPVEELLSFDLTILIFMGPMIKDMNKGVYNNIYYSISMAKMWEARSLYSVLLLFCQRKLLRRPIKSSLFSFLWLLWMFTKYWIRLLLSSKIPSISSKAKVISFWSPVLTFFTISKKSLMYSSALFFYIL